MAAKCHENFSVEKEIYIYNLPYFYRITFSVKILLLSLRVLLKLKVVK